MSSMERCGEEVKENSPSECDRYRARSKPGVQHGNSVPKAQPSLKSPRNSAKPKLSQRVPDHKALRIATNPQHAKQISALRSQLNEALLEIESLASKNNELEKCLGEAEAIAEDCTEELYISSSRNDKLKFATEELVEALQDMESRAIKAERELDSRSVDQEAYATDIDELQEKLGKAIREQRNSDSKMKEYQHKVEQLNVEVGKLTRLVKVIGSSGSDAQQQQKYLHSNESNQDANDVIRKLGETILREREDHELQVRLLRRRIRELEKQSQAKTAHRSLQEKNNNTAEVSAQQSTSRKEMYRVSENSIDEALCVTPKQDSVLPWTGSDEEESTEGEEVPIRFERCLLPPPPPPTAQQRGQNRKKWVGAGVTESTWDELNVSAEKSKSKQSYIRTAESTASHQNGVTSVEHVRLKMTQSIRSRAGS